MISSASPLTHSFSSAKQFASPEVQKSAVQIGSLTHIPCEPLNFIFVAFLANCKTLFMLFMFNVICADLFASPFSFQLAGF